MSVARPVAALALLLVACAEPGPQPAPRATTPPAATPTHAATATEPASPGEPVPDDVVPPTTVVRSFDRGPEPLADPAAAGIGAVVSDLPLLDVAGAATALALRGRVTVVLFTTLRCPLSRLYQPGFAALAARLAPARVVVVDPDRADDPAALAERARAQAWPATPVLDRDGAVVAALRADRTTEAFLIDDRGVLRWRGAIDDQYGIGYRRAAPTRRLLEPATRALLEGRPIDTPPTDAPGCKLR